eukprot:8318228-Pyramimonas_sp.AAC.1
MFLAPSRLATAGERAPVADGASALTRARQRKILADMDAHKGVFSMKGANGWRPHMRRKSAIRKGARVAGDVDNYFVDICCHDFARFDAQSDDEARGLWDELAAQAGH